MAYKELAYFLIMQTPRAIIAAVLFMAGAMSAGAVMRFRVKFLLAAPGWFAQTLVAVLARNPSMLGLGLFIFCFNSVAMCVYMFTGVIPGLPYIIAFMTGLNIVLAAQMARPQMAYRDPAEIPNAARLCGTLTFLLEIPSFWYTVAMGTALRPRLLGLIHGENPTPLLQPLMAYIQIIVPILAVSAFVEAYAVTRSRAQNMTP